MSNDSVIAGPLCKAATVPVSTKIPLPMVAPRPMAIRARAPRVCLRRFLPAVSVRSMCRTAHIWRSTDSLAAAGSLLLAEVIRPFADCAAPRGVLARASLSQARPPLVRTTARGGACASIARPATPVSPAILEEILT